MPCALTHDDGEPRVPVVGRYQLKEKVGAGGMGSVWSAWDPRLARRVALKLSHTRREGGEARFVHERHILAGLEHPHIARLLDAGETDDQRPWFAMDYVDGLPIDQHCERFGLGVRQRVELLLPVLAAVEHAHRHLVVHRDVKPANVLVDGAGQPHLVDFGIARMLEGDVRLTQTGQSPMTPAWASPEQVRGEAVTTSTDVYSLGVMLYELLCGASPYRPRTQSVEALLDAIREQEPELCSKAAQRVSSHASFAAELEGDLDAVVARALRKNPADRYGSVTALAADLRAYLEGSVTEARRGDARYRLVRFVRRHRLAVGALTVVVLSLAGGLTATLWQARLARSERDRAQHRFEQLRSLARTVLFDYHDGIADLPGATAMRERLVKDALRYLDSLSSDADGDLSLQSELAVAYVKVGDVQGDPFAASLGDTEGARKSYLRGREFAEVVLKASPRDRRARAAIAKSDEKLGSIEEVNGRLDDAVAAYRQSVAWGLALVTEEPNDAAQRSELARAQLSLGQVLLQQNKLDEAETSLNQALASKRAALAIANEPLYRQGVGAVLNSTAELHMQRGQREAAIGDWEEAAALFEQVLVEQPASSSARRGRSAVSSSLASAYLAGQQYPQALALTSRGVALSRADVEADPQNAVAVRDLAVALGPHCVVLAGLKRFDEALAAADEAEDLLEGLVQRESTGLARRDVLQSKMRTGYAALDAQRWDVALGAFTGLRDGARRELEADPGNAVLLEWLGDGHYGVGSVLSQQKKLPAALGEFKASHDALSKLVAAEPDNVRLQARSATALTDYGHTLLSLSRREEGCAALKTARGVFEGLDAKGELPPAMRESLDRARSGCE